MRELRAICLLCRVRQIFQTTARRGAFAGSGGSWTPTRGRWHTTAADVGTTSANLTRSNSRISDAGLARNNKFTDATRALPSKTRKQPPISLAMLRGPVQRKKRPRQSEDSALAIFQDIVEGQQKPKARLQRETKATDTDEADDWFELEKIDHDQLQVIQQQSSSGRPLQVNKELYSHLVKLTQLRSEQDATIADLFAFFQDNMYPLMIEASDEMPNIFRQACEQLIRDVSAAKRLNYFDEGLPSVARITEIRRQLGLLSMPASWMDMVLELVEKIMLSEGNYVATRTKEGESVDEKLEMGDKVKDELQTEAATQKHSKHDNREDGHRASPALSVAQREILLNDLVETWRIFSLPDIVVADPETLAKANPHEFRMPTPDPLLLSKYGKQKNLQLAIATLFPRYSPQQLQRILPPVLSSYAVLTDPALTTPEAEENAEEFLFSVGDILCTVNIDRRSVAKLFSRRRALAEYMLVRWPLVGDVGDKNKDYPVKFNGGVWVQNLRSIRGQLTDALHARNLQTCELAWERFWAAVSSPDFEGARRLHGSSNMFDYFIKVFTTMRMPDRAIAVWNLMTMAGVRPTLCTWTSFIDGCKLASNPTGIHNIWEKLIASGIQVDTAVWTARISGLIQAGEAEAGMQALEEMQLVWEAFEASERSSYNKNGAKVAAPKAVKPTIEPVNAAIAGVLRLGDMDAAKNILAWAGRHGIEPDLITFNTILRPLVRDGRGEEAAGLLDMMRRRGIEPDEATATILLDGAFGGGAMAGRSSDEKCEAVKQVLAEMEAAGLEANQQTYAKIIYLLLEDSGSRGGERVVDDQSDAAVQVVLDRMRRRGIALSSHIYTILAEHYFSRNPPDLESVQCLIETGQPPSAGLSRRAKQQDDIQGPIKAGVPGDKSEDGQRGKQGGGAVFPASSFDRVFWERVVRGFAQVGDTQSAQKYFAHISDSLALTGSMLEDLLRALIHNGEWDAAAKLVTKVRDQKMLVVQGGVGGVDRGRGGNASARSRVFRHRFWHLASEHNLL